MGDFKMNEQLELDLFGESEEPAEAPAVKFLDVEEPYDVYAAWEADIEHHILTGELPSAMIASNG